MKMEKLEGKLSRYPAKKLAFFAALATPFLIFAPEQNSAYSAEITIGNGAQNSIEYNETKREACRTQNVDKLQERIKTLERKNRRLETLVKYRKSEIYFLLFMYNVEGIKYATEIIARNIAEIYIKHRRIVPVDYLTSKVSKSDDELLDVLKRLTDKFYHKYEAPTHEEFSELIKVLKQHTNRLYILVKKMMAQARTRQEKEATKKLKRNVDKAREFITILDRNSQEYLKNFDIFNELRKILKNN